MNSHVHRESTTEQGHVEREGKEMEKRKEHIPTTRPHAEPTGLDMGLDKNH